MSRSARLSWKSKAWTVRDAESKTFINHSYIEKPKSKSLNELMQSNPGLILVVRSKNLRQHALAAESHNQYAQLWRSADQIFPEQPHQRSFPRVIERRRGERRPRTPRTRRRTPPPSTRSTEVLRRRTRFTLPFVAGATRRALTFFVLAHG